MNSMTAGSRTADSATATTPKKRAVVMIHGIGSQSPMETIRGFVEAVWKTDPRIAGAKKALTWSQRDHMSENLESRRVTTNADKAGVRTDFFEFYWAHLMEDTQLTDVVWWIRRLSWRPIGRVPETIAPVWWAGWICLLLLFGLVLVFVWMVIVAFANVQESAVAAVPPVAAAGILLLLLWFLRRRALVEVAGDAARYLTAAPSNIGARTRIRLAGLELLEALHNSEQYDRIILVGHSLGTVVGYDLINFLWSNINDRVHHSASPRSGALALVEAAGCELLIATDPETAAVALAAFRRAQRLYFEEVRAIVPRQWLVSDFVTIGSPLTHGHFLLVNDGQLLLASEQKAIAADWLQKWWIKLKAQPRGFKVAEMFRARATQRELTLCPPITETGDEITYDPKNGNFVVPHHGAPFAAVR